MSVEEFGIELALLEAALGKCCIGAGTDTSWQWNFPETGRWHVVIGWPHTVALHTELRPGTADNDVNAFHSTGGGPWSRLRDYWRLYARESPSEALSAAEPLLSGDFGTILGKVRDDRFRAQYKLPDKLPADVEESEEDVT